MIKALFSKLNFEPTGVANVAQSACIEDVLLLKVKSQQQQEEVINKALSKDFKGAIVSPFLCELKGTQSFKASLEEISQLETELINHFYPIPQKKKKIFGVTGTNGKTSTAFFFAEAARQLNFQSLYLGTMGVFFNGKITEDKILTTTPSYLDLRKLLSKYEAADFVSLELSSHALNQGRLECVEFDVCAWTNFTQDHLDYHKTMEEYFKAKLKIKELSNTPIVIPYDESDLRERLSMAHVNFKTTEKLENSYEKIPRFFSEGFVKKNIELALKCLEELRVDLSQLSLAQLPLPPGRFEVIEQSGKTVIIDYAHTPDALRKVVEQAKSLYKGMKIVTLFGCGGDRDKSKRKLMGGVASEVSVRVIVTSDNPRTEEPNTIIEGIIIGVSPNVPLIREVNREEAIRLGIKGLDKDELLIIAGKGHEEYQEINGVRHPFSDREKVLRYIND